MIDVIVGGQFGSEGKGKVAYIMATKSPHKCVARIGGPNSGHTARGKILRCLPVSTLIDKGICIIGAGSYIDVDILYEEISKYNPYKLYIDSKAVIIKSPDNPILKESIGSTLSGTGSGVIDRVSRYNCKFITSDSRFTKYITDTQHIHALISKGCIIEGTQGFGLSNIHSPYYPYVTSRDTTASGFLSEMGIGPKCIRRIYLIFRTYPIRVAGNSGRLFMETSWKNLGLATEYTSVTKLPRRVGNFDIRLAKLAIMYNSPSHIILNHLDYIKEELRNSYIAYIEKSIGRRIDYIGLSSDTLYKL